MFGLRHRSRFLALWTLAFGAVLLANPLSPFGWVELVAVAGPFLMAIDRRIWREAALAIGVPVISPCSFVNAMTEPVNVTAPIQADNAISISDCRVIVAPDDIP